LFKNELVCYKTELYLLPCKTNIGYSFQHMYICYTGRNLFVILNNKRKLNPRPRLRFARYVWSLWYKY